MQENIRLILIDDHEMVLQGLSTLLDSQPGLEVIGQYTNGHDAIRDIRQTNADVILTDINMPIINGFETAQKLKEVDNDFRIIMLSMEVKEAYIQKAKEEGVAAYVSKNSPIQELISVIKKVYLGQTHFQLLDHS